MSEALVSTSLVLLQSSGPIFAGSGGARGMSLLTARRGAEGAEDDEGWREKRDNTSLFGRRSAEALQKPSASLCRTGEEARHVFAADLPFICLGKELLI